MYEILVDTISSPVSVQNLKQMMSELDQELKFEASVEDQVIMVETKKPLKEVCSLLQDQGLRVAGAAVFEDEDLNSHKQCHLGKTKH